MRNEWYGDKRDVIKWSVLLHLAQREGIGHIFQIAMRTDMEPVYPENIASHGPAGPGEVEQDVIIHVIDFFHNHNDLNGIVPIGEPFNILIEVKQEVFTHANRDDYFAEVWNTIGESEVPTIWFFDPDTGIEPPSGANKKHLRLTELSAAFALINEGDYLGCYQHAWPVHDWQTPAVERLSQGLNIEQDQVEYFMSDYSSDVLILAVSQDQPG